MEHALDYTLEGLITNSGCIILSRLELKGTALKLNMPKKTFTSYAREQLGHYVYALRNPLDGRVFYVGKGVDDRVFDHANDDIDIADDQTETSMKVEVIRQIYSAGKQVEAWIIQHGLSDDAHAFHTESAVYGTLKLLDPTLDNDTFVLTNIVAPPTHNEFGLMSVDEVLALYGEEADTSLIPHNSMFIKPTTTWYKGMSPEDLKEYTRGWWPLMGSRARSIRYVFSAPNLVIRAVWEVSPDCWREQGPGDHGWEDILDKRAIGKEQKDRWGFDGGKDVTFERFEKLLNKSVRHTYTKGQGTRASCVYLDDKKCEDLRENGKSPFWNVDLR